MRFARAILALYVLVWFTVVVPGHTRGILTMPGEPQAQSGAAACCASTSTDSNKNKKPTPDQQRRCAVCFVAANYTVPVVFTFDPEPAECVAVANLAALAQVFSIDFPTPFWPVGPPGLL